MIWHEFADIIRDRKANGREKRRIWIGSYLTSALIIAKKIFTGGKEKRGTIDIRGDTYRFFGFEEILNYLHDEKIEKIIRNFKKPDFLKLQNKDLSYFKEFYSPNFIEKDFRNFYSNLYPAYQCIFRNNFPWLIDKVTHFHNATKLLVYVRYGEAVRTPDVIRMTRSELYLRNEEDIGFEIEVFFNVDIPFLSTEDINKSWDYKGKKYQYLLQTFDSENEVFDDLGMLKRIYKMIWETISQYYGPKNFPIDQPQFD